MTLGERLSSLREKRRLTQIELAMQTKISRSRLSLYETDKREPDLETIKQLAKFFGTTTDYLLGYVDDPHKKPPTDEQLEEIMRKFESLSPEEQKAFLKKYISSALDS